MVFITLTQKYLQQFYYYYLSMLYICVVKTRRHNERIYLHINVQWTETIQARTHVKSSRRRRRIVVIIVVDSLIRIRKKCKVHACVCIDLLIALMRTNAQTVNSLFLSALARECLFKFYYIHTYGVYVNLDLHHHEHIYLSIFIRMRMAWPHMLANEKRYLF